MSKEQKTISGQERTKKGIIAGILGLITNILLFVAKFAIGLFLAVFRSWRMLSIVYPIQLHPF